MRSGLFVFLSIIILGSCKDSAPQPSDMVGYYTVSGKFSNEAIDENEIKSSISDAMKEAKAEIAKAKEEINLEFDLSSIDTSTTEGKIEYTAKKFSKSMAELGTDMGEVGTELGSLFANLTTSGIDLGENLLKNIKFEVELQADGDLKVNNQWITLGLNNAKWEVKDDQFILFKDNNEAADVFLIKNRNSNGFELVKDELEIQFVKSK
jgi:hypothetical protein